LKTHRAIFILFALLLGRVGVGFSQDYVRLGERDLVGTARYVGMAGAMTAIGGDPSAVRDNPAGLGLYRRTEVSLTGDMSFDRTIQIYGTEAAQRTNCFTFPQAAVVFALGNPLQDQGVIYNNIMLSYHRLRTFARGYRASATDQPSLSSLIASLPDLNLGMPIPDERNALANAFRLDERGTVNEYTLDWAMNISHRWYIGFGLRMQSYALTGDAVYQEEFSATDAKGNSYALRNVSSLLYSGVGWNAAFGLIWRPCRWWRMGVSIETPTLGGLSTRTAGTLYAQTDSLRSSQAPETSNYDRRFHEPMRLSAGAAAQLGTMAFISLQYDYAHGISATDVHSLRAGVELVPIPGMCINAGYAYEWNTNSRAVAVDPTFDRQDAYYFNYNRTQYASVGLGYRGQHVIVQAAYQYRWQRLNIHAHEAADPYRMHADTHRIVLTLGWHRPWP